MADFNDSPVEGIAADVPVNPEAQAIEQYFYEFPVEGIAADRPVNPGAQAIEQNFDDLKRKRLAQAHKFRSVTFYTILGLVVIMIVTSVAALVHELFRKGGPSDVVNCCVYFWGDDSGYWFIGDSDSLFVPSG